MSGDILCGRGRNANCLDHREVEYQRIIGH
jgi:hypothetical protein